MKLSKYKKQNRSFQPLILELKPYIC